jgi:O-antigen/teichoic acid export membrane protein
VAAGVINLAGNIALVPFIGSMGASIATVFTQIITAFWSYYYVRKLDNTPYEIKRIGIIVSSSIAFSLISLFVQPEMILIRLLFNLLLLFSWPALLYFCGVFEQTEIDRLKQAWVKWRNPKSWKRNIAKEIGKA